MSDHPHKLTSMQFVTYKLVQKVEVTDCCILVKIKQH